MRFDVKKFLISIKYEIYSAIYSNLLNTVYKCYNFYKATKYIA